MPLLGDDSNVRGSSSERGASVHRMAMLARVRSVLSAAKFHVMELRRLVRTAVRARSAILVRYTKAHPIYVDVLEEHPPHGFAGYRPTPVRWLRPLDRWLEARVRLLHVDAAS